MKQEDLEGQFGTKTPRTTEWTLKFPEKQKSQGSLQNSNWPWGKGVYTEGMTTRSCEAGRCCPAPNLGFRDEAHSWAGPQEDGALNTPVSSSQVAKGA
jgi:hypothetical protein